MKIIEELRNSGFALKPTEKTFGLEFEAEFSDELPDHFGAKGFKVTGDGSLRGYGYEFVSLGAKTFGEALDNTKALFETEYYKNCWYNSPRASTHIHRNVQNLTHEDLIKVLFVYYLIEPVLCKLQGADRDDNYHCLPMHQAEGSFNCLRALIDREYQTVYQLVNDDKYTAMNLCNIPKLGTIEFRMFPTTKDIEQVHYWLSVIEYVVQHGCGLRSVEELWEQWRRNRNDLLVAIFGEDVVRIRNTLGAAEVDNLLDCNYSQVFAAYVWYRDKDERRARRRKKVYTFSSELDYDLGGRARLDRLKLKNEF